MAAAEPSAEVLAKTAEARELLKKLHDGARQYYLDTPQPGPEPVPAQFPSPSVGPTPPLGACCKQGGTCRPESAQWMHPTWEALHFSVDDPHHYSYEYIVEDKFSSFRARAYGDLDCDGVYSTFELTGSLNDGVPVPAGEAKIRQAFE